MVRRPTRSMPRTPSKPSATVSDPMRITSVSPKSTTYTTFCATPGSGDRVTAVMVKKQIAAISAPSSSQRIRRRASSTARR